MIDIFSLPREGPRPRVLEPLGPRVPATGDDAARLGERLRIGTELLWHDTPGVEACGVREGRRRTSTAMLAGEGLKHCAAIRITPSIAALASDALAFRDLCCRCNSVTIRFNGQKKIISEDSECQCRSTQIDPDGGDS